MAGVKLSVEDYINQFIPPNPDFPELLALESIRLNTQHSSSTTNTSVQPDNTFFMDPKDCDIGKTDLDIYLPNHGTSESHPIDIGDNLALNNDFSKVVQPNTYGITQIPSQSNHVLLSQSVGVTMLKEAESSSSQIEIVHDLELTHKPRYKSDYHSQGGTIRRPRYVSDAVGNHFVLLKVAHGTQSHIRIDWVTILNENNIRYSMPYKFQDKKFPNKPLLNPTYEPINNDISGLMKLYLILIKSKQDELKNIQPLQQFPPIPQTSRANNGNQMPQFSPKDLIKKYQLEKSQLAFTKCTLCPDGKTYIYDWNTTVYSTVLTERPCDTSKKRKITCPKCEHSFEITIGNVGDINHETVSKKRKK